MGAAARWRCVTAIVVNGRDGRAPSLPAASRGATVWPVWLYHVRVGGSRAVKEGRVMIMLMALSYLRLFGTWVHAGQGALAGRGFVWH